MANKNDYSGLSVEDYKEILLDETRRGDLLEWFFNRASEITAKANELEKVYQRNCEINRAERLSLENIKLAIKALDSERSLRFIID